MRWFGYCVAFAMPDIEIAVQRWKDTGPLSAGSTNFLIDLRDANFTEQPGELIWAAFVRSLTAEQKSALLELLQIADRDEVFRLF